MKITQNWKLQRASEVSQMGEALSKKFDDSNWIPATVPGTVLVSYLNNGAIPDPNFGDNQFQISDEFFTADFWYRTHFTVPADRQGKRIWLNFNNINWKADVWFNGVQAGRIEGAFIRGKFDITEFVQYGGDNCLAVYIHKNDNPGSPKAKTMEETGPNGGVLGADNPTIHASIGWDWVPTIRGRNIGIYGDVFLSYSGAVTLNDPWVETKLEPDFSKATLIYRAEVANATDKELTAAVRCAVGPVKGVKTVTVPANGSAQAEILMTMDNPRLWWPNRYGEQYLYAGESSVEADGAVSDRKEFNVGIREIRRSTEGVLKLFVNGARIFCSGGNWGMDESMLRLDAEGYDIRVRLHKEAGFTMIRNWVGQTGNKYFYRACDKYGILIFDDFWLANPGDGPVPNDEGMFMANAADKIKWVRKHPSVAFYCGRNEGNPPESLDNALREAVAEYDGSRGYFSHSADGQMSGWGPYNVKGPEFYFENSGENFHTERGMPNIPAAESIRRMMPEEYLWPIPNPMWGLHDFTTGSAQGGASFLEQMKLYGEYNSFEEFVRIAQMVNYENHKALFEAPLTRKGNAMLMWMSQPAWPSMVWQTYDYYFDTNAGYFGAKTANQTVSAIYHPQVNGIVVTNNSGRDYTGLVLEGKVYSLRGSLLREVSVPFDLPPDSVWDAMADVVRDDAMFIKLRVKDGSGGLISENFYWAGNRGELQTLDKVTLQATVGGKTVRVRNPDGTPALLIRVKILTDATGRQVLPAYYSDNYFSLMPGEEKTVAAEFDDKYLLGEKAEFFVEGWNIFPAKISP
jgi:hypothetical protein